MTDRTYADHIHPVAAYNPRQAEFVPLHEGVPLNRARHRIDQRRQAAQRTADCHPDLLARERSKARAEAYAVAIQILDEAMKAGTETR